MYIEIKLNAVFTSPFLVSTGALADSSADKPTFKDGRGRPIIPGSALKGRLRHTCEKLIRTLQTNEHAACQSPNPQFTCPLDPDRLNDYCPICKLFGSPRRPSSLVFTDLSWAETELELPTTLRTGVSIGRSRRVAEPQRLFRLETVAPLPQLVYQGEIYGHLNDDTPANLMALLVGGLKLLNTLGGQHTRGLGQCQFEIQTNLDGQLANEEWLRKGLESWRS